MNSKKRIEVGGGDNLAHNPFAGLDGLSLPQSEKRDQPAQPEISPAKSARGGRRVEVRREKAGRGGKTVTVIRGLESMDTRSLESLASDLRRSLGVGGALKGRRIELQGDHCDALMSRLAREGFRPVRTGG